MFPNRIPGIWWVGLGKGYPVIRPEIYQGQRFQDALSDCEVTDVDRGRLVTTLNTLVQFCEKDESCPCSFGPGPSVTYRAYYFRRRESVLILLDRQPRNTIDWLDQAILETRNHLEYLAQDLDKGDLQHLPQSDLVPFLLAERIGA